jgi:hypothetical protein
MSQQTYETISATIVPVDLYNIIHPVKDAQFAKYGKHSNEHYESQMQALREGRPQQRLQDDRLAREIVKALLEIENSVPVISIDYEHQWLDAVVIHAMPDNVVSERVGNLIDDGLLDFYVLCHEPHKYAFQSEIIKRESSMPPNAGFLCAEFEMNGELRAALKKMLEPFDTERPLYTTLESRSIDEARVRYGYRIPCIPVMKF